MAALPSIPANDLIRVEEVEDGAFFAGEIFRQAFGDELPGFNSHLVKPVDIAEIQRVLARKRAPRLSG